MQRPEVRAVPPRASTRPALLEIAARAEAARAAGEDETQLIAALREIVGAGRSRADELWELYRGGVPDGRARLLARFAD